MNRNNKETKVVLSQLCAAVGLETSDSDESSESVVNARKQLAKEKKRRNKKKRKTATISSLRAEPLTTSGRPLSKSEIRNAIVKKVQRTKKSRRGRQAVYSSEESSLDSDSQ